MFITSVLILVFCAGNVSTAKILHVSNIWKSFCNVTLKKEPFVVNLMLETLFKWANDIELFGKKWEYQLIDKKCERVITSAVMQQTFSSDIQAIIGPETPEEVISLSEMMKLTGSNIPIVTYTEQSESAKSSLPSVYFTFPTFMRKIDALFQLIKKLGWNYLAVIESKDSVSRHVSSVKLKELASKQDICFTDIQSVVNPHDSSTNLMLRKVVNRARSRSKPMNHFGVVFFGSTDDFIAILNLASPNAGGSNAIDKEKVLRWILIAEDSSVITPNSLGSDNYHLGTIVLMSHALPMPSVLNMSQTQDRSIAAVPPQTMFALQAALLVMKSVDLNQKNISKVTVELSELKSKRAPFLNDTSYAYLKLLSGFYDSHTTTKSLFNVYNQQNNEQNIQILKQIGSYKMKTTNGKPFSYNLSISEAQLKFYDSSSTYMNLALVKSVCPDDCQKECLPADVHFHYKPGNLIVGLFAPVHDYRKKNSGSLITCNGEFRSVAGFEIVKAFEYAIEVINYVSSGKTSATPPPVRQSYELLDKNLRMALENLIPKKITFGYVVFDSCYSHVQVASLLSNLHENKLLDQKKYKCEEGGSSTFCVCHVLGYIGGLSSSISTSLARILNQFKLPQISYGSTAIDLSNSKQFPYFMRTVGTDADIVDAQLKILNVLRVNYVAVLYDTNTYGKSLLSVFEAEAANNGICLKKPIAFHCEKETCIDNEKDFFQLQDVVYVALLMDQGMATKVLKVMKKLGHEKRYIFLLTESAGTRIEVVDKYNTVSVGAFTIELNTGPAPAFEAYMRTLPATSNHEMIRWFSEFWERKETCNLKRSFFKLFHKDCKANMEFIRRDNWSPLVMNAVFSMVLAASKVYKDECPSVTLPGQICDTFLSCRSNGEFKGEPDIELCRKRSVSMIKAIRDSFNGQNWAYRKIIYKKNSYLVGEIPFNIYQYIEPSSSDYEYRLVGKYVYKNSKGTFQQEPDAEFHKMNTPSSEYKQGCTNLDSKIPPCPSQPKHEFCVNWKAPATSPPENNFNTSDVNLSLVNKVWRDVTFALIVFVILFLCAAVVLSICMCRTSRTCAEDDNVPEQSMRGNSNLGGDYVEMSTEDGFDPRNASHHSTVNSTWTAAGNNRMVGSSSSASVNLRQRPLPDHSEPGRTLSGNDHHYEVLNTSYMNMALGTNSVEDVPPPVPVHGFSAADIDDSILQTPPAPPPALYQ